MLSHFIPHWMPLGLPGAGGTQSSCAEGIKIRISIGVYIL